MTNAHRTTGHPADAGTCPSWCLTDHDESERVHGPQRHVSDSVLVPGIALAPPTGISQATDRPASGPRRPTAMQIAVGASEGLVDLNHGEQAAGVTLSVALHRKADSPLTWVYIGDGGPGGWEISSETAWLLIGGITELLRRME